LGIEAALDRTFEAIPSTIFRTNVCRLIVLSLLRSGTFRAVLAITNSHPKRECLQ
jgi:hypothetical protein